jgi:hypothetical protein
LGSGSQYDFGSVSPSAGAWGEWTLHQRQTIGSPSGGQVYVTTFTQLTMDTGANSHQTKEILLINSLQPFDLTNDKVELYWTLKWGAASTSNLVTPYYFAALLY